MVRVVIPDTVLCKQSPAVRQGYHGGAAMNDEREGMGAAGCLVVAFGVCVLIALVFGAAGMAILGG